MVEVSMPPVDRYVEYMRAEWPRPKLLNWRNFAPETNIANLWWREATAAVVNYEAL
jgi:hypothetical protein